MASSVKRAATLPRGFVFGYRARMSVALALDHAAERVLAKLSAKPEVGVVLGSGLGAWGDGLQGLVKIPYAEIPGMPASTIVGHAGNLCLGRARGVSVACLQGRVHLYEGHEPER